MHDGFSGGAFLDMAGALIGVTTAARIRGLGVVIPAGIAWKTAGAVIEHGRLKRGYIGIAAQRVRLTGDQRPGPDRDAAMLVMAVTGGSPAARAGVLVISDQTVKFHVAAITGVGTPIRVLEAERIPDRDRHLADAHLLRIAERGPGQRSGGSGWQIEPQHREIGPAIVPDDVTAERSAVRQRDPQRPHIADDVAVGEDEPVRREDEAGSTRGSGLDAGDSRPGDVDGPYDRAGVRVEQVLIASGIAIGGVHAAIVPGVTSSRITRSGSGNQAISRRPVSAPWRTEPSDRRVALS